MLATFLIEMALLVYTVARYKMSPVVRIAATALLLLGLFQLAEYNVCGRLGVSAAAWSRVGFVAITLLPPLGVHLAHVLAGRRGRIVTGLAYVSGLIWAVMFGFSEWAFSGHVCAGNYVIFQLRGHLDGAYFAYYYFWLLTTIGLSLHFAQTVKKAAARKGLLWLTAGYLIFMMPTAITNSLKPETISGLPSILCGFAVLFALVMSFGILPTSAKRKSLS